MRIRIVSLSIVVLLLTLAFALGVYAGSAGSVEPPAPPDLTSSYTLEDIYNRLDTGAAGSQGAFTEPAGGPGTGTMHTLDDIMAIAPAEDDTNGAAPADVLSGKTYWGLRADGAWGPHMGTAPPAPAPKTGQIDCWDSNGNSIDCDGTGQDGDLQKGVLWPYPRFTDNADGTVTDNLTGLIWLKDANCTAFFMGDITGQNKRSWSNALGAAKSLSAGYCGLSDGSSAGDWRLPNVWELQSLVHYGVSDPAVPNTTGTGPWSEGDPFTGIWSNYYWSSTTSAFWLGSAWAVFMFDGIVYPKDKTGTSPTWFVWPVRGGQ